LIGRTGKVCTRVVATIGLVLADTRATVAVRSVVIVALFAWLEHAIATHLLELAHHVAAVVGEDVAVVALLAGVDVTVAAAGFGTADSRAGAAIRNTLYSSDVTFTSL